jgi:NADH-quinone oxidoreductase subunit G
LIRAGGVDPRGGEGDGYVVASWRMNLDGGRGLDGEPHLAGTARVEVARLSPGAAARLNVRDGEAVKITGPGGGVLTLPLAITTMADGVVWLPGRVRGTPLGALIGAGVAQRVQVTAAEGQGA